MGTEVPYVRDVDGVNLDLSVYLDSQSDLTRADSTRVAAYAKNQYIRKNAISGIRAYKCNKCFSLHQTTKDWKLSPEGAISCSVC